MAQWHVTASYPALGWEPLCLDDMLHRKVHMMSSCFRDIRNLDKLGQLQPNEHQKGRGRTRVCSPCSVEWNTGMKKVPMTLCVTCCDHTLGFSTASVAATFAVGFRGFWKLELKLNMCQTPRPLYTVRVFIAKPWQIQKIREVSFAKIG